MASPFSPEYTHCYADLNGIRLHYVDVGPHDGIPVVLLHGWPDLWWGWRHQIQALRATYRVIVPDQRGFGATTSPDAYEAYRKSIVAHDYALLLDHLGLPRAVFLGHDWGGAVAWAMAQFYPSRVLAVGAICTPYIPQPRAYVPLEMIAAVKPSFRYQLLLQAPSTAALFDAHAENVFTLVYGGLPLNAPSQDLHDVMASVATLAFAPGGLPLSSDDMAYYVAEYARQGFAKSLNWYQTTELDWIDARGLERVIPHNALFISAGKDPVLRPEFSAGMEKWLPNLTRGHVPNGTHWVLWEFPDEVNAMVKSWLASLGGRAKM